LGPALPRTEAANQSTAKPTAKVTAADLQHLAKQKVAGSWVIVVAAVSLRCTGLVRYQANSIGYGA
jgi:hypothetical protein